MKSKLIVSIFCILLLFLNLILFVPECLFAQDVEGELDELFAIFTEEEIVVSALKRPRTVSRSPSIMSVITAEQIKRMGFKTLSDALKTVPGFDISMDTSGEREFAVRGVYDSSSQKVKLLIDGHSVNEPGSGGASWNFDDLVVENVKRIEVIRGPGSALYGQNAFLAVINVITKDTEDIDGFQWTASGGNFDTQNYNMLLGKEAGDLKISGFFDYYDTVGPSEKIEQDVLSTFPIPISESPGKSRNRKEKTDLNLKLMYNNLELKGKYMKKRREDYAGFDHALNDETILRDTYIFTELIYKIAFFEKLNMKPKVYYDQYNSDNFIESIPDSVVSTTIGEVDFTGEKILQRVKQRTLGFENQFNYDVFEGNELTFGFQYEWIYQHDIHYASNRHPETFEPLPELTDFSHDYPFTRNVTRQIWGLYLQDEWNIIDDIDLTVGVRHDQFKRFGGTTNPRVGLIWRFLDDAHMKLLFATAFRAPNFHEMFISYDPTNVKGNPDLDPEKINTFEVSLGYSFTKNIRGNINYFFNRIRDRIVLGPKEIEEIQLPDKAIETNVGPSQFINSGGARIKGVEAELRTNFGNDNYFYANYTFQDAEETRHRNRLPYVPVHKANLGINIGFWKYINANIDTFISGSRPREDGDTRHDLPSHALVNLTLIGRNLMENFEIRGSVFNLFDKSYDDPSPIDTIISDYPQPGISCFVELRYQF